MPLPEIDYATAYHNKNRWHLRVSRFLRQVALRLPGGRETDVRSNKAGPGILGEVVLHTTSVYVCIALNSPASCGYCRTVTSRKDYTGGGNQWMPASWLHLSPEDFASRVRAVMPC